jgi:DNA polymerase-3 subunit delta
LLHIFFGENDFTQAEALTEIKKGLGDEATVTANTSLFQGKNTTPEEVTATCDTIPFLAPHRLVIVEGLLGQFEQQGGTKRSQKAGSRGWFVLEDYAQRMPENSILVLIDGKLKKSNPLLKGLTPHASVREFKRPSGDELNNWIRSRVIKCGGNISPNAVRLLAGLIGGNLWLLSNEIDKLCTYATGSTIEKADVELLVADAREPNIFAMIDAILERRSASAIKLLHRLEEEGAAPPYLLFMITRQFRLVIQAKDLLRQRHRNSEIGRSLGITSDYALQKTIEQAKKHSAVRLVQIYHSLLDTDISIKTGRLRGDRGDLALDLFISELCE